MPSDPRRASHAGLAATTAPDHDHKEVLRHHRSPKLGDTTIVLNPPDTKTPGSRHFARHPQTQGFRFGMRLTNSNHVPNMSREASRRRSPPLAGRGAGRGDLSSIRHRTRQPHYKAPITCCFSLAMLRLEPILMVVGPRPRVRAPSIAERPCVATPSRGHLTPSTSPTVAVAAAALESPLRPRSGPLRSGGRPGVECPGGGRRRP